MGVPSGDDSLNNLCILFLDFYTKVINASNASTLDLAYVKLVDRCTNTKQKQNCLFKAIVE